MNISLFTVNLFMWRFIACILTVNFRDFQQALAGSYFVFVVAIKDLWEWDVDTAGWEEDGAAAQNRAEDGDFACVLPPNGIMALYKFRIIIIIISVRSGQVWWTRFFTHGLLQSGRLGGESGMLKSPATGWAIEIMG